jgi:hypothetical protein
MRLRRAQSEIKRCSTIFVEGLGFQAVEKCKIKPWGGSASTAGDHVIQLALDSPY